MPMISRRVPFKSAIALCSAAVLFAIACSLAGCGTQSEGGLPSTHLDQSNEVAASHERCGACHQGGTRGDGTYIALEYEGMESLPPSGLVTEPESTDPSVTESLYIETPSEEGAQ